MLRMLWAPSLLLILSFAEAQQPPQRERSGGGSLIDAHRAPLSALTSPRSYYFLEFPIDDDDAAAPPSSAAGPPRCEDESPFGFLFRRGTDAHVKKLLVEFEGASTRASTPWHGLKSQTYVGDGAIEMPPLGSCTGISEGLMLLGASLVGFGDSIASDAAGEEVDVPIFLRGRSGVAADAAGDDGVSSASSRQKEQRRKEKVWWEHLSGEYSSVHDWSYLFVPHCTPSQPSTTAVNVQEVSDWVATKFAAAGGFDALITVSGGGRIGGCSLAASAASDCTPDLSDSALAHRASSSSLAALSFAKKVSASMPFDIAPSKTLVVMDGATLWNGRGANSMETDSNATLGELVQQALSSDGRIEVAWVASATLGDSSSNSDGPGSTPVSTKEDDFLRGTSQSFPSSFHVYRPVLLKDDVNQTEQLACPLYAFSDASDAGGGFSNFLRNVVKHNTPWDNEGIKQKEDGGSAEVGGTRLSFLSIFLILIGLYLGSWGIYFLIKRHRQQQGEESVTHSPHDLWFLALTKFPVTFLFCSVAIPVILSCAAYAREGSSVYSVNLDFDSYLDIDTTEERVAMQYRTLLQYQMESLEEEEANCQLLYSDNDDDNLPIFERKKRERSLLGEKMPHKGRLHRNNRRGLQSYGKRDGRTAINFFYQNPNGGTVFAPPVLESIREFEEFLMGSPGFDKLCYSNRAGCYPFNSIVPYFYPGGSETLVEDIEGVLRTLSGSKDMVAKMDKYFSKENLGSNVTLTTVTLNDINGSKKGSVQRFLKSLHHELWKVDQGKKYPDVVISWNNDYMREVEAADALKHDFKWSLAALCFIALMVFVKVRNVFEVFAGVLGLVLSFTAALYWQYHFDFDQLTAMHVAGIYVMLGIGADDIFLTIDSFEHTKVDFASRMRDEQYGDGGTGSEGIPNLDDPEIIKQRMVSSYKTAGSMLLVSSVTTAICFFSNIFSALVSISDFGSYMGVVVVLNYIHVMTILPSAIIVYEVHVKPFQQRMWDAFGSKSNGEGEELDETNTHDVVDADLGIAETGVTITSLSQFEEVRQDNGRHVTAPETIFLSNDEPFGEHDEALQQTPDDFDYNFLYHTKEMTALDRYFVQQYAPFVYMWRKIIVTTSLFVAFILGMLAWLNFTLYDGTIIVFKEKYNLGRVQKVIDEYFPEELIQKYAEDGLNFGGNNGGDASVSAGDIAGSTILDVYTGGGSPIKPARTTTVPTASPTTSVPSSHPSSPPSLALPAFEEENTTAIVSMPPFPPVSEVFNAIVITDEVWYPNWIGDIPECLNDGLQPNWTLNDLLFDTKFECCHKMYASNPVNCMGLDSYIDAFKCDGADFNRDASDLVLNTQLVLCIKSKSSDVNIDYLSSLVITQGENDLTIINDDVITFPSITSREFSQTKNGVLVLSRVPTNMFNFESEPIKITGSVFVKPDVSADLNASEEASFELNVYLRQENAPQAIPPVPGPKVPGPNVPLTVPTTVPGTLLSTPQSNGSATSLIFTPTVSTDQAMSSVPSQSMSQSNTSASLPSPWYPVWDGISGTCSNDGLRQPSYMNANPGFFLFDTLAECCAQNFAGDNGFCLGINNYTMAPTIGNRTASPFRYQNSSPTATPTMSPTPFHTIYVDQINPASLRPTNRVTPLPTFPPSKLVSVEPSLKPTLPEFNCPPGLPCLQTNGATKAFKKSEYYLVSIVWGMRPIHPDPNVWVIRDNAKRRKNEAMDDTLNINCIDPSDSYIQEWLLKLVTLARNDAALRVHRQLTWIEMLKEFTAENGIDFPLPKSLFIGVVDLLKARSKVFRALVRRELATKNPGIAGEFLFTSLSLLSEVPLVAEDYSREVALKKWTNYTDTINELLPENLPPINAQSEVFMDSYRMAVIVESTVSSYLFANGLILLVILFFMGNLLLTLMVMASLILILMCFGGLILFVFQIEFGPVESLGVSIFVGLSANYLLHIAHSYHKSNIKERNVKIQRALFVTGSPILWSAISTIGGSIFLFACRTWLLTELGILICAIIALSLMFSVGFLLALLALIGPLPIIWHDNNERRNLHSCDMMVIIKSCFSPVGINMRVASPETDP